VHILIVPSEHFVVDRAPFAGIFQHEQARALARAGHKVGVISVGYVTLRHLFARYPYEARERDGLMTVLRRYRRSALLERYVPPAWNRRRYVSLFDSVFTRYHAEFGTPDVVHAHGFLYAGVLASHLWDIHSIPFVLTEHSSAFARGLVPDSCDEVLKDVACRAKGVSCVSQSLRSTLEARVGRHCSLLPNMVDPAFLEEGERERANGDYTFLTVGSLDKNKNHELLLHAFAMGFKGRAARLQVVGEGPLRYSLEDLARNLQIDQQVDFLGPLSRYAMRKVMRAAHCFVLPSNYETFGVVVIEALASGLPVVATRCGGPEDIVTEQDGVLVDKEDAGQMCDAMQCVMDNSTRFNPAALRAHADARFGEKRFVENAMALYTEAGCTDMLKAG
jgi:glycosyltransferase involved in cell wall biosynthesis